MSKPPPRELLLLPAFIWKTIWAVSLKIRSGLAKAGVCQGANCLKSPWAYTALCSDKFFLCFPEKSDLLKHSHLLFSPSPFLLYTNNWIWKFKNPFPCQLQSSPSLSEVVSLPTQGRKLPHCVTHGTGSHFEESADLQFSHRSVISGAGSATLPRVRIKEAVSHYVKGLHCENPGQGIRDLGLCWLKLLYDRFYHDFTCPSQ